MYSSYGSYSSMSAMAQPLDIAQNSCLSRSSSYHASCAFPSWPQRSSLGESEREERASSYLSDDDLFVQELEDDGHSFSSASSTASISPQMNADELAEMRRHQMMREQRALEFLINEKERRRQASRKQRRASSGSKKSPKSKSATMTAIVEGAE